MRMCRSPELIAACHVLLRLLMPRHSPCALFRLTSSAQAPYRALRRLRQSLLTPLRLLFLADLHPLGGRRELRAHVRYWFSELCRLIQDLFFYEIVTHFLSSTFASEFPSVALLVFPLFSFQCAVVDASSAYSVSASSLAASRENFISLCCISSSNRSLRFDLIWDEGFSPFPRASNQRSV